MIARKHHGKSFKYLFIFNTIAFFFYLKNILDINLISRIFFKIVNNAKIYSMIYIHDSTFCNLTIYLFLTRQFIFCQRTWQQLNQLVTFHQSAIIIILIDFLSRFPRSSSSHGVYKMYALASSFDKSASFHLKSSRE